MTDEPIEFTDRYQALGMPYPDPETMCKGECDGTGIYPVKAGDPTVTDEEMRRWTASHNEPESHVEFHDVERDGELVQERREVECDGWHFITCPDCEGTGKAKP